MLRAFIVSNTLPESFRGHKMKALNLLALFGATFGFFGLATSGPTGSPRIQLEDADRIIWPDIHHSAASSSFNPQAPTDRKFGPKNIDGDLRSSTIDADRIYWHDITHSSSSFNPPGDSRIIWPDIHHSAASASFHPQVGLNPVCNETKNPGLCTGYFPRYYFNNVTKTCEQFIYGGCWGNGNNFHTLEECKDACSAYLTQSSHKIVRDFEVPLLALALPKVCTYPPETGPCEAAMSRYYYNTTTETCEVFTYGGCHGNGNRFRTYSDCEKKCMTLVTVIPRA
ncbi:hypothetical protein MRX96_001813 [Rhipicephalus microplus]